LPKDPALLAERPEARNLVGIYAAATGESEADVLARFAGQGFGAFKPALADALVALIAPLRSRLIELRSNPVEIDRHLAEGAEQAKRLAAPTLAAAYRAVGLTR
jgi:tryptophanyl-tRNA synthetase